MVLPGTLKWQRATRDGTSGEPFALAPDVCRSQCQVAVAVRITGGWLFVGSDFVGLGDWWRTWHCAVVYGVYCRILLTGKLLLHGRMLLLVGGWGARGRRPCWCPMPLAKPRTPTRNEDPARDRPAIRIPHRPALRIPSTDQQWKPLYGARIDNTPAPPTPPSRNEGPLPTYLTSQS